LPSATSVSRLCPAILDCYHNFFSRDRWHLKALVYTLFAADVAQTMILTVDWYGVFARNFGDVDALSTIGTTWLSMPVINATGVYCSEMLVACMSHAFVLHSEYGCPVRIRVAGARAK
jgi:hypothetical protein